MRATRMNAGLHPNWLRLALVLSFALLAGCSAIRIGYNQADTILAWIADDYFDFDAAQKQDFNTRMDRLLQWHRHDQLPDYAHFLTGIKQRVRRQFTRDDAAWVIDGAIARYRVITRKGAPDAAEMLMALTPDNIRALEKQFEKVNQKFAREYKLNDTFDDRRRARLDRTLTRIRDWTGALTQEQEERIAALNNTVPYTDHLRLQDRQRRQKEFLSLLNTRHHKAEFPLALRTWLADWEKGRPPELHAALYEGYEKRIALYLEIERMLTPPQREHVLHKLQDYIDDIHALAARRAASQ